MSMRRRTLTVGVASAPEPMLHAVEEDHRYGKVSARVALMWDGAA